MRMCPVDWAARSDVFRDFSEAKTLLNELRDADGRTIYWRGRKSLKVVQEKSLARRINRIAFYVHFSLDSVRVWRYMPLLGPV